MAKILQFLIKIEIGIHIASLLIFIPTTIMVFLSQKNTLKAQQIQTYQHTYDQIVNSFILSIKQQKNCTLYQIYLNNNYCLQRCQDQRICSITNFNELCPQSSTYSYSINNIKYCSDKTIINSIDNNDIYHDDQKYPIYKITQEGQIIPFNYAPKQSILCQQIVQSIGQQLQQYSNDKIFLPYKYSLQFLWFTTLPVITTLIIFMFIDKCCKFNLRIPIIIVSIVLSMCQISLIIKGISFYALGQLLQSDIVYLSDCMIGQYKTILSNIQIHFGLTQQLTYFCGFLCLMLSLMIGGLFVIRIVEYKYWKLKKKQIDVYELKELK